MPSGGFCGFTLPTADAAGWTGQAMTMPGKRLVLVEIDDKCRRILCSGSYSPSGRPAWLLLGFNSDAKRGCLLFA